MTDNIEIEKKPVPRLDRMHKDQINECPIGRYEGPIRLIRSEAELPDAVRILEKETLLGFDTETRPAFRKGESYPPAILQLAGANEVFIFQLKFLRLPRLLLAILENPNIIKSGVSIAHDLSELRKMAPFEPAGFIDIGNLAREKGIQNHGLRGLAAVMLGFRITKGAKTTNWNMDNLSPAQLQYAATDAWVGRKLYGKIRDF